MGYARHIGRVGALAVTLGVGAAIANAPGVAYAETPGASPGGDPTQKTDDLIDRHVDESNVSPGGRGDRHRRHKAVSIGPTVSAQVGGARSRRRHPRYRRWRCRRRRQRRWSNQ